MNLLFIGSLYSESFKKELRGYGFPTGSAGQTFEAALVNGLDKCSNVKVISEYFIPFYPKYPTLFVSKDTYSHFSGDNTDIGISFINLPILKKLTQFHSYKRCIRDKKKGIDAIIVYEVTSRQLLATVLAAKEVKKIVIVPDLPEFMSSNRNLFYLFAKRIDKLLINYALRHFDGYVLLSPFMQERIVLRNKPWMVLEGLFDTDEMVGNQIKDNKKVLFYSGKIERWFGIHDLLEAFTRINGEEYRLWLCGPGDINMVSSYSTKDPRIQYLGCLSHKKVLELQKQATILVNPRHSTDEYTFYSFPSKTMEYMASGTPTLMCKLPSLPEDYYSYLYFFDNESISGMSSRIKECLDKSEEELHEFGARAALYVTMNKSAEAQARRLVDFVKGL